MQHVFTGFGFGPIQGGLFACEAFKSGQFSRIVIAEIDQKLVDAVRAANGSYFVNIAHHDRIEACEVRGIEIYNPTIEADRQKIIAALAQSTEIATSLPSVKFFSAGGENSVAGLIGRGLKQSTAPGVIVYTGENNNHAAEILQEAVGNLGKMAGKVQYLNTVIGKMSQVVTDPKAIARLKLRPMAPSIDRAFLVEAFNRILVTRTKLPNFTPGISVFIEKNDLLPFEEAKLFGHNAIHALLAYLGSAKGYVKMTDLAEDDELMGVARVAFINESGGALCRKYQDLGDALFTPAGYRAYAEDLLVRMTNPFLEDTIERAGRDPLRKLAPSDRIFGTMSLALEQGIAPERMALGAAAGLACLLNNAAEYKLPLEWQNLDWKTLTDGQIAQFLHFIWGDASFPHSDELIAQVQHARSRLRQLLK